METRTSPDAGTDVSTQNRTLHSITEMPLAKVEEQLIADLEVAMKSLMDDVRKFIVSGREQMDSALHLGWDVIVLSTIGDDDMDVKEVISKMRSAYEAKKKYFPSDATIYRATGPLQRIIGKRAGLSGSATKPHLKKNRHLLLLLPRSELPQLAAEYPGQQLLCAAFPTRRSQVGEVTEHGAEILVAAAQNLLKEAVNFRKVVRKAKRSNSPVPNSLTALMDRVDEVVDEVKGLTQTPAEAINETPDLPFFATPAA